MFHMREDWAYCPQLPQQAGKSFAGGTQSRPRLPPLCDRVRDDGRPDGFTTVTRPRPRPTTTTTQHFIPRLTDKHKYIQRRQQPNHTNRYKPLTADDLLVADVGSTAESARGRWPEEQMWLLLQRQPRRARRQFSPTWFVILILSQHPLVFQVLRVPLIVDGIVVTNRQLQTTPVA